MKEFELESEPDTKTGSLFPEIDEESTIKIPREKALGNYKRNQEAEATNRKAKSPIGEKLKDFCIATLQDRWRDMRIDTDRLLEECRKELEPEFESRGLIVTEGMGVKEVRRIEVTRNHMIRECAKRKIDVKQLESIRLPVGDFIDGIGSQTFSNAKNNKFPVGRIVKQILSLQDSAWYEWSEIVPSEDGTELNEKLHRSSAIPRITFVLNEAGIGRFKDISGFIKARTRDKTRYLEAVELKFDHDMIYNHILFTSQYTLLHADMRKSLQFTYAFRLDEIVRSIMWQQKKIVRPIYFHFDDLQEKFGVRYSNYWSFKQKVLMPAINDLNTFAVDIKVELGETKQGRRRLIYFRIQETEKRADSHMIKGVPFLAYYISCVVKNSTRKKPEPQEIEDYARFIESTVVDAAEDWVFDGGDGPDGKPMTMKEWRERSRKSYRIHSALISHADELSKILKERGMKYDSQRLALVHNNGECVSLGPIRCVDPVSSAEIIKFLVPNFEKRVGHVL